MGTDIQPGTADEGAHLFAPTDADGVNGSWPDGLPKKDGANALSGAGSDDTATTQLGKTSRTKKLDHRVLQIAG